MITDFHTHTFPDEMAHRVIGKLSSGANMKYYADGTVDGLRRSMEKAGIERSVIVPIATTAHQTETINQVAVKLNERCQADGIGIISFGSIHPDNANYKKILRNVVNDGIKGIKLHPLFQDAYFDDVRYMRIVEAAAENDLVVLTHAGYDISFPGMRHAAPEHILPVIKEIGYSKLVLAHLGGWCCWDDVECVLVGQNVYFDTSFAMNPVRSLDGNSTYHLSREQFSRIVRNHGADRILLGSDSPWTDQTESIELLQECGFDDSDVQKILSDNAEALLG